MFKKTWKTKCTLSVFSLPQPLNENCFYKLDFPTTFYKLPLIERVIVCRLLNFRNIDIKYL